MSRIRNVDTKPELIVRRLVWGLGYRYRLHDKNLPGKPDIVFKSRGKIIFVHGCFWHQDGCSHYRMPKTRKKFWEIKLSKNLERDRRVRRELRKQGWSVLVIWECQLKKANNVSKRLIRFMEK